MYIVRACGDQYAYNDEASNSVAVRFSMNSGDIIRMEYNKVDRLINLYN